MGRTLKKRSEWWIGLGKWGVIAGIMLGGATSTFATTTDTTDTAQKAEKEIIPVQFLGINDFHGALSTTGSAYIEGKKYSNAGTAALLAGYLNQAENSFKQTNTSGQTFRVQAGDMVGASPANSGLLQDEPTIKIMNQMKIDVGTLGNHEFDEGLDEFSRILKAEAPSAGKFNQITQDYPQEAAKQEIVIANVENKSDGKVPNGWQPYTIKEVSKNGQTVKVGFIGVVTTDVPNLVLKKYHEAYNFLDEAETIVRYEKELRTQGVQAIVVLAHDPSKSSNGVVSEKAATIMEKVNTSDPENSVDIFFAGHNHEYTNGIVGNTRIVQSTSQGKAYIDVTGELDSSTKDFVKVPQANVTPVLANGSVQPDADVQAIVTDASARVQTVTEEKIGTAETAESVSREVNADKESALGNLVTDAQVAMARAAGFNADFALTNNGGIRSDLAVRADKGITWGAAQNVQPFGNILQVVEMTGTQIKQVLAQQFELNETYFLQMSGLKMSYTDGDSSANAHQLFTVTKADGTPLSDTQTYQVVINDFLYGGGDGFSGFTQAKLIGAIDSDTETFVQYIKKVESEKKTVDAKIEGRKTYLSKADIAAANQAAIEMIQNKTTINPLYAGTPDLSGKTVAGASVTATLKGISTTAVANENGEFTVPLSQEQVIVGAEVTLKVTDLKGNSWQTKQIVQPVLTASSATSAPVGSASLSTTNSSSKINSNMPTKNTTSGKLPQTGEKESTMLGAWGALSLIAFTVVTLKRKKTLENN